MDLNQPKLHSSISYPHPVDEHVYAPKVIFLTGATGLLGANLLGELLANSNAEIYCLIRASDPVEGALRVKKELQFYKLWKETYRWRIKVVIGDLSSYQLGISEDMYLELSRNVDSIYHCGASTNMTLPYNRLYSVNVASTLFLLEMAGVCRTKSFHYVSTVSVALGGDGKNIRNIALENPVRMKRITGVGGYLETKVVSEQLIEQAKKRGLPASIYRVGRVMGESQHGRINNLINTPVAVWKAAVLMRQFPNTKKTWSFVPVDFVSKAIRCLSLQKAMLGKVFHIYNLSSISWDELFSITREYGYSLDAVSINQWLERAVSKDFLSRWLGVDAQAELSLLCSMPPSFFTAIPQRISSYHTIEGLSSSSITCPPIDENLLRVYLGYMEKVGFFPKVESKLVSYWRNL